MTAAAIPAARRSDERAAAGGLGALDPAQRLGIARQILITRQLGEVLPALAAAGVPAVLLKGTAFWTELYAVGERPVSDIDLLVRDRDLDAAGDVLVSLGYHREHIPGRAATERAHYNRGFTPPPGDGRVLIEVHRAFTHWARYDWDRDGLLGRSEPCALGRLAARRLAPEDNLLHLAIHRTVHGYGFDTDPRNLEDAHRLVTRRRVDWPALVGRARDWGAATALWILLDSARARSATPVPADVLAALRPGPARRAHLQTILVRDAEGAWTFRWPGMTGLLRSRGLVFPLVVNRPRQMLTYLSRYATQRLRDLTQD